MNTSFPHSKRRWRFWMIVLVLGFLLAGIGVSALRFLPFGHARAVFATRTFPVAAQANVTISITGTNGNILVHGGTGQAVNVTATIERHILGSDPAITYTQVDQNHLQITGKASPLSVLGANSVMFDVAVPAATNLDLQTGAGDITVSGIHGQLHAQNTAGAILVIKTTLTALGALQTTAGSITFNGNFTPIAHYQFSCTTGSITLALPATSSFHVDASTTAGSITSDFSGIQVMNKGAGGEMHGDVNNVGQKISQTWLSLHTSAGSIALTQVASPETFLW